MVIRTLAGRRNAAIWILATLALAGLALSGLAGLLEAADATATGFTPGMVSLESVGATATVTVEAAGVDPATDGVQINIQHPAFVTVTEPACTGIFAGGVPTGPSEVAGGTLIGCFFMSGNVKGTAGGLMTFTLTRTAEGEGKATLGIGGGFGTAYSDAGSTVGGPGATNKLDIKAGPPKPPVIGAITPTPATLKEGDLLTIVASFSDPNSGEAHSAPIDWGDGSPTELGVVDEAAKRATASHAYSDNGDFTITVTIGDEGFLRDTKSLVISVGNVPPTLNAGPDKAISEGGTFVSAGSFADPGADTWSATVDYGDGSGVQPLTLAGKTFAFSHVYKDNGAFTVSVSVTDDDGGTGSDTVLVTVSNVAPVVHAGPDKAIKEGETFSSSGSFADPGADTWTATVDYGDGSGAVPLALNPDKTFTLSHLYVKSGLFTVTVTVTDDDGGTGSDTAIVTVSNVAPVVNAGADAAINEGDTFTGSGSFADPGADSWSVTVSYGDGSGTAPLTLNPDKTFSLSHLYKDNGTYTVTVTVTDGDGGTGSDTAQVTVANVAPTVEAGPDQKAKLGEAVKLPPATFADPGALDTHTATVDWGDGSGAVAGTVNEAAHTVSASHTYAKGGLYSVVVAVTDKDGGSASDSFKVSYGNEPPVITSVAADQKVPEGVKLDIQVATFADPDAGDTHSALIDWGDGSPATPGVVNEAAKTVNGSHVYADNGVYTVKVTVSDGIASDSDTFAVTVTNAAPIMDAGDSGAIKEGEVFSLKSAGFTDPGTLDTHTATVDWGDGSPLETAAVAESPSGPPGSTAGMKGSIQASHLYADNGRYRVQVCVKDDDGASGCGAVNVQVSNVAPIVAGGATLGITEGDPLLLGPVQFADPGTADTHTATVNWGDGSPPSKASVDQAKDTAAASHVYADNGTYTVTLTVADDDGGRGSASFTVHVSNAAPRVDAMFVPEKRPGFAFTAPLATYHDPGTRDTHKAIISWGDGSTSKGSVYDGLVYASHRYLKEGVYTVTITVIDGDGGVGQATLTIVVRDPFNTPRRGR